MFINNIFNPKVLSCLHIAGVIQLSYAYDADAGDPIVNNLLFFLLLSSDNLCFSAKMT